MEANQRVLTLLVVMGLLSGTLGSNQVTISPSSANILNNAGHTITAVFEDVTSPYTSLTWTTTPVTTESLSFTTFEDSNQNSVLTLSKEQVMKLSQASVTYTFTCEIVFGSSNWRRSDTQVVTIFDPAVTMTPTKSAYTMKDHVVECKISSIPWAQTNIEWSPITGTAGAYTTSTGSFDTSAYTQTATLTISATELGRLKGAGAIHTFTCKVTIGDSVHSVQQELTLFTPSISVAPAIETIFTYNGGHTISCVFSDILDAITGVTWAPATQQQNWYSLEDGTYSSETKSQTSTLYIHSSVPYVDEGGFTHQTGVQALKNQGRTHFFTCAAALDNLIYSAQKTLRIFSPYVTIPQSNPIVYAVDSHVIKCVIRDTPEPETEHLKWTDLTDVAWEYGIDTGEDTFSEYYQTSTLTFTSSDLETLHRSTASQTFSCKLTTGNDRRIVSSATQTFTIYKPSVSIATDFVNVYSMDKHKIECKITDIPSQISAKWSPIEEWSGWYSPSDGIFGGGSQTAALTIYSHQLNILSLKNSGDTHTFTCMIEVGENDTPITSTQTIAVYTPTVKIEEEAVDVYTVEEHTISCQIEDIPEQVSVTWSPISGAPANSYKTADTYSVTSQTSTLTISTARLAALKGSGRSHSFTCSITVGGSNSVITATQTISIYTPTVTVSPSSATVYTVDDHDISCQLSDLPNQYNDVTWSPAINTANSYYLDDGNHSGTSQTSTLKITSSQLVDLKKGSTTVQFTCAIMVGRSSVVVSDTQTIVIYTPAVQISNPVVNVYAMDSHVINCQLSDLPALYTGVTWSPATELSGSYSLVDGTRSGTGQTSSLTITSYQLQVLMHKRESHSETFTCEILVGKSNTPIRATREITIYHPMVSISPATANVYTLEDHVISCKVNDIPSKMNVDWTPTNGPTNSYFVTTSELDDLSEISTLRITSGRLATLKGSSKTHTFTCKINVGNSNTAVTATQTITLYTPTVTITTPTTDVYSMDSHTISCVLADIPEPWIDVMWAPAMQLADSYEYDNGHRSFWENTQMATLEISGPQLASLKSSSLSHTFTCKIAVGASKTIVSDTQTISIYTPTVSISPASQNVYTYDDHIISCKLKDIPSQATGIQWSHAIDFPRPWVTSQLTAMMSNPVMHLPSAYSLEDGTFSSMTQTATLSITSPRLALLKGTDKVHLFTCKYEFGHGEHMHSVTAVQSITLFSPTASITPDIANVFTFDDHVISCVLSDIPSLVAGVTWNPAVSSTDMYTLRDGYFSGVTLSQTSSLEITSAQLTKLGAAGRQHTFTCLIRVGKRNTPVTATQMITVYTPKAAITPDRMNIWSHGPGMHISPNGEDHTISCLLTDLPHEIMEVSWDPAVPEEGRYTLEAGFYNARTQSQESTLTIANTEIADLLGEVEDGKVTFTCEIVVGKKGTSVKATQSLIIHEESDAVFLAMIAILVILVLLAILVVVLVVLRRRRNKNKNRIMS